MAAGIWNFAEIAVMQNFCTTTRVSVHYYIRLRAKYSFFLPSFHFHLFLSFFNSLYPFTIFSSGTLFLPNSVYFSLRWFHCSSVCLFNILPLFFSLPSLIPFFGSHTSYIYHSVPLSNTETCSEVLILLLQQILKNTRNQPGVSYATHPIICDLVRLPRRHFIKFITTL